MAEPDPKTIRLLKEFHERRLRQLDPTPVPALVCMGSRLLPITGGEKIKTPRQ